MEEGKRSPFIWDTCWRAVVSLEDPLMCFCDTQDLYDYAASVSSVYLPGIEYNEYTDTVWVTAGITTGASYVRRMFVTPSFSWKYANFPHLCLNPLRFSLAKTLRTDKRMASSPCSSIRGMVRSCTVSPS